MLVLSAEVQQPVKINVKRELFFKVIRIWHVKLMNRHMYDLSRENYTCNDINKITCFSDKNIFPRDLSISRQSSLGLRGPWQAFTIVLN